MNALLSTSDTTILQKDIEDIINNKDLLAENKFQQSIYRVLRLLETGALRVVSPADMGPNCGDVPMEDLQNWVVHSWVKESILLAMKLRTAHTARVSLTVAAGANQQNQERVYGGQLAYHDKFDLQDTFAQQNVRALPGALAREGSHLSTGTILMPSFVNIGAWVGANTMVDTWATVGSCAQIGKNVHIAGGAGIGGVLEPANARPVLVGDGAFIGSRAIVVEGVIVGEGAILGANCCLTFSTPVYDVTTNEKVEYRGVVPPRAIVVPGTRLREFPGGEVPLACCYIIGYRDKNRMINLCLTKFYVRACCGMTQNGCAVVFKFFSRP